MQSEAVEIAKEEIPSLTHKQDYSASHEWIEKNPNASFVLYPSCRDPQQRLNAAILDIQHLAKNIKRDSAIKFFYDNQQCKLIWIDYSLSIQWGQVC